MEQPNAKPQDHAKPGPAADAADYTEEEMQELLDEAEPAAEDSSYTAWCLATEGLGIY